MEIKAIITQAHYKEFVKTLTEAITTSEKVKSLFQATKVLNIVFFIVICLFYFEAYKYLYVSKGFENAFWISSISYVLLIVTSWQYRKKYMHAVTSSDKTILGRIIFNLDEKGITETGDNHTFFCTWVSINKITETKNLVILHTGLAKGVMIPVENKPELRKEIIEFAESKISANWLELE